MILGTLKRSISWRGNKGTSQYEKNKTLHTLLFHVFRVLKLSLGRLARV